MTSHTHTREVGTEIVSSRGFEVYQRYEFGDTVLGWVIEQAPETRAADKPWVAWTILSPTGDSFLGQFQTANEAISAILEAEKKLEEQRRKEAKSG